MRVGAKCLRWVSMTELVGHPADGLPGLQREGRPGVSRSMKLERAYAGGAGSTLSFPPQSQALRYCS
jgi:hypothetical protein